MVVTLRPSPIQRFTASGDEEGGGEEEEEEEEEEEDDDEAPCPPSLHSSGRDRAKASAAKGTAGGTSSASPAANSSRNESFCRDRYGMPSKGAQPLSLALLLLLLLQLVLLLCSVSRKAFMVMRRSSGFTKMRGARERSGSLCARTASRQGFTASA